MLAHLSGDDMLMQSFAKGEDIHRRTASEVFHVPMEEVTAEQRRTAKAVNFGIIYGQTDYGLSRELGISRREAQAYIDLYFSRYPLVQTFIHDTIEQARAQGYVTTMMAAAVISRTSTAATAICASSLSAPLSIRRSRAPRQTSSSSR